VQVKLYKGCLAVAVPCEAAKECKDALVSTPYVYLDYTTLTGGPTVTSTIHDSTGGSDNLIGSTDGQLKINFTPGDEFPKYGGLMKIFVP
jgi:hypothetical protein